MSARARAESGFVDLFRTEYPAVLRTVYFIVDSHSRAEDVTQEAFLQLFSHWKRVARYDRPGAWVRRVAIRQAVRERTRDRKRSELEKLRVDAIEPQLPDVDLQRALRSLSRMQRAVTVLHYLEERPVAEIVDLLGISDGSVKVHLHRARQRLATQLREEVNEDAG